MEHSSSLSLLASRRGVSSSRGAASLWLLFLTTIVLVLGLGAMAFRTLLVKPTPPPIKPTPAPVHAPSKHVMLVIVDGFRYDYGTDPSVAPNYARHMHHDTHARLIAERVTMTSAAVVAITSGQRGDFAQLITNLNVARLGYNDFISNAQHQGLKVALVGDETWRWARGPFDIQLFDDHALAIEVDDSEEMLAKAHKVANTEPRPSFMIAHFIAPDHQGHAYGTAGERYHKFFKKFDKGLEQFLSSLAPDWTVIVTSDHGQTDTGAHGTDTPIMRQSPMFAYGPGIAPNKDLGDVEQINLGPTLAALLGVPVATHARGTLIYEMLDMPEEQKAQWACAELDRVQRVAEAYPRPGLAERIKQWSAVCAQPQTPAKERIEKSRLAVTQYDQDLNDLNRAAEIRMIAIASIAALIWLWLLSTRWIPDLWPRLGELPGPRWALGAWSAAAVLAGVSITYYRERIPSPWHLVVLGLTLVAIHIVMLRAVWRPTQTAESYRRHYALALTAFPGVMFLSYPANTSPETFVVLLLGSVVLVWAGAAEQIPMKNLREGQSVLSRSKLLLLTLAVFATIPYAFRTHEPHGGRLFLLGLGLVPVAVWLLQRSSRTAEAVVAIAAAVIPVLLRPYVPSVVGVAAVVVFPVVAVVMALRNNWTLALGFGFGSYGWLSRDTEVLPIALTLIVLDLASQALKRWSKRAESTRGTGIWTAAIVAGMLFSGIFLARYALQGGLDTDNIDYAVGGFGDPNVSEARLIFSLVWKYVSVYLLLMATVLRTIPRALRIPVSLLMFFGVSLRVVDTIIVLFTCRRSYWTAFRTFSDLIPMIALSVASGVVLLVVARLRDKAPARGNHQENLPSSRKQPPEDASSPSPGSEQASDLLGESSTIAPAMKFAMAHGRPRCAR